MRSLVFREELLPASETFITEQVDAMRSFTPSYVGLRVLPQSAARFTNAISLSSAMGTHERYGELRKRAYHFIPFSPSFHRSVRRVNACLLHAHFALDATSALALHQALGIPLIVTLHGYDVTTSDEAFQLTPRGRRYMRRRPTLWSQASRFLCVSEAVRRSALLGGFPEEKLQVHYIGIDCSKFQPVLPSQRQEDLVLFVGRLVEKKGCAYLLQALSRVRKRLPLVRLVIIGDGPMRESLEQLARELSLDVTFLGFQPSRVVREWMGKARVLCNPSVSAENGDSEGFGMVLVEAQATGLPVVSSLHGGIPEAISDGNTGLLAPERDVAALAEHIHRFMSDTAFWQACSSRATAWVRERFDLHKQTRKLESIYKEVSSVRITGERNA
jgi:colanic acid/amylovoran biosynthesis glycosyltransferase